MKLTDPGIIKEGEKDLIDAIKDDLDLDSINEIIKDKLKVKNLESKGGKIIVHNNKVAFQIEFELSLNGSLMFDRDGNYISDDNSIDVIEEPELQGDEDKEDDSDKEEEKEEKEEKEDDIEPEAEAAEEKDDEKIESDELSEIDLDVEGFEVEDDEDDDIDFSDDEDIDDILKESRAFWENKKSK